MNRDQMKGAIKDMAGKVQRRAGEMFHSRRQEEKGLEKQAAGQTQQTAGDVKDAVKKQ
ncbi:CsbD family protein [Oxalobacteraceae bacterium OM1]|nr:CsbD family protein [Oxalobacteraceae bacterium OM1]